MAELKFKIGTSEIYARGEALQWMVVMGWSWAVIDSIMYDDCPDLEAVRRLVYYYGPDEALRRIKAFIQ